MADPITPVVVPDPLITLPGVDPNLQPKQISPDDDPNLKLQRIVGRRKEAKTEDKPTEDKPVVPKAEPKSKETTQDTKKLSGLIGKALGFREDKEEEPKKDPEKPKEPEDKGVKEAKEPEKPKEEPAKTIVKPKKAAPTQPPAQDLAKVAATAAAAAVKAVLPETKGQPPPQNKPEDFLTEGDLHEYEVAGYLAKINPKYKDAQKIILDQAKKAEAYASNWEADNKGKLFDPDDEEHNDFYAALKKPWSETEFHSAEMDMAAEKSNRKIKEEYDRKIAELEMENARSGLAGVVDRTVTVAAGLLAKKIGPEIHDKIVKETFDKFSEEDPLTAEALANAMGQIQPLIEAAIQLDDPKARFKFNPENEIHREWNRLMLEKEEQLSGTLDTDGKKFASRAEFSRMGPAERNKHWYLTTEHLIESLVEDASESVKSTVEKEKERQKKIALSLGFVPKENLPEKKDTSDATKNGKSTKEVKPEETTTKPTSPASGGGAKVDDRSAGNPAVSHKLLETTASILFRR